MDKQTQSIKFLRQRKFLLVLPLLVLPFLTFLFWALGGGGGINNAKAGQSQKGFNMNLPDAFFKSESEPNKMKYYDQATQDSIKRNELIKDDPYYHHNNRDLVDGLSPMANLNQQSKTNQVQGYSTQDQPLIDANEILVTQKLDELQQVLNEPPVNKSGTIPSKSSKVDKNMIKTDDVDRLEQMMQNLNQSDGEDPEMQQLNGMLEKILDIQHPDRVKEKLKKTSSNDMKQVHPVKTNLENAIVSSFGGNSENIIDSINQPFLFNSNAFYGLAENLVGESSNAINAVIAETQTILNGAVVKLRLMDDIYLKGIRIPKNHLLFGIAQLNGERLQITIEHINYQHAILPVQLSIFDIDGMPGVFIPGVLTKDVVNLSANQAIQDINLSSFDPSIGAQAMGAGIDAAKTLFTKKTKLVKVTLKGGYQVLLLNEQQLNATI